jgi:hypothetical protein
MRRRGRMRSVWRIIISSFLRRDNENERRTHQRGHAGLYVTAECPSIAEPVC